MATYNYHRKAKALFIILFVLQLFPLHAQTSCKDWLERGNDLYEQQQFSEAVICFRKAAEMGDAEAQFNLGYALFHGEGIQRDYAQSALWFKRAARQDFLKAKYNLAYCYMNGRGVPIDYDKAIQLLMDAAQAGLQQAQLTLAECYSKGILVPQNQQLSQQWMKQAQSEDKITINSDSTLCDNDTVSLVDSTPQASPMMVTTPPQVNILYPENLSTFHSQSIKIRYQLVAPGLEQQTKIIVMVDGEKCSQDRTVRAANTLEIDVPTHDCTIVLYAQNANGNSEPASIKLRYEHMSEERPRLFAVAIGVDNYSDPMLPPLKYAIKDAQEFSSALRGKLNFPYSDVQVQTLCNGDASREDFFEALRWLAQESRPTDVCIFYYAGHGYRDDRDRFYFMPYGAHPDKLYNCFSAKDFLDATEDIHSKTLVFVDACFSGAFMQGNRSSASQTFIQELQNTRNGMILYASSGADTKSKEDEQWGNGAFTKALIEAFEGKANKEGTYSLSTLQLYNYLYDRVRQLTNFRQTPIFQNPNGIEQFSIFTYEP